MLQDTSIQTTVVGFSRAGPVSELLFFVVFTLVTGPRGSLSLKLSDTRASNTRLPLNGRWWEQEHIGEQERGVFPFSL